MDFRNIDHWDTAKLSDGFVFCIQRLDELLFDYTIDSYKPRALNAPSLCIELLILIKEVEDENIDKANISYVLEELKSELRKDKVAKSLIDADIEYFTGYNQTSSYDELKLRISVLERSLEPYRYIKAVQIHLIEAIKENRKDDIGSLLSTYVTTFINWGISKQFLFKQMNNFFFNKEVEINDEKQILDFFEILFPKTHSYCVYFQISNKIKLLEKSLKFFSIKIIDSVEGHLETLFSTNKFKLKPGYVTIEITGIRQPDPYIARDIAERRLETIRNASQLFFHQGKIKWNKTALVVQKCCENEAIIASSQINPMKKSFNYKSSQVANKTNKIFQKIALRGESFKKFNRAMSLHSNCLLNQSPENQLVNLWTILETIVPSSKKKSKVQNICTSITPLLLLKYSHKLVLTLFNDLVRWNEDSIMVLIDGSSVEEKDHLCKFLMFLTMDIHAEKRKELYQELNGFCLLRNRVFKLSETLKEKDNLLNSLDKHELNVTWQIRRVYRTRNMVVHSGKSPNYINILIENAHDYIDQVMAEIIEMATSNYRIQILDQAFEFGRLLNSELRKKIKSSKTPEDYLSSLIRGNEI